MAGVGFIALYYAIHLGNVSLVNAMLGLQFMFTFLLALALRNILHGDRVKLDKKTLTLKLSGIGSILIGVSMLYLNL